jgi:fermentation-respiration switch protein FrsA (DUF1100 family)
MTHRSEVLPVLTRILILLLLIGWGWRPVLHRLQRALIYARAPGPVPVPVTGSFARQIRPVSLTREDQVILHGWLSSPAGAPDQQHQSASDRWLVILFPGNAGTRANRIPILADFNSLGCHALIFDYRGYGENAGRPTEAGLTADAQAIFDFACNELRFAPDRILLCGQSLGGGVATRLAWELSRNNTPPAGLILRATFTSLVDAAKVRYPWLPIDWVLVDRYPSIDRIPQVTCPVLVIHGGRDTIVPASQGERLFAAAPDRSTNGVPKQFLSVPQAGHNDLQALAGPELHAAHGDFIRQIQAATQR